jgi:NADPH:quinone reductase-like Zn-dependent oxidoreductase
VSGDIGIHIDRTFTLAETAGALAHVGEGHALGKVVVLVDVMGDSETEPGL